MKRGMIKRFREYLNMKCVGNTLHRHNKYHQVSRGYGDYLYFQDRAMFNVELSYALEGKDHKDFQKS